MNIRNIDQYERTAELLDIHIRSDGGGRTVEAYAAVFNTRARINDQDGIYWEVLSPQSFNKTIADNGTRFGVFYNHAMTIHGKSDGALSVPIGVPQEVRATDNGVWTVTDYLDNPLADSVLDGIKRGAIRGQSFSGRFVSSQRSRATRGELPTITRNEVAMREYGPTVFPAYQDAAILGVRSWLDELANADPEDLDRLRSLLGVDTLRVEPSDTEGTPSEGAAASTTEPHEHSGRQLTIAERRAYIARLANPRRRNH